MLPASRPASSPLAEALALAAVIEACADCEARDGLCQRHRREIVPQLARPMWVRLMGVAQIEQAELQDLPPEAREAHRLAVLRYVAALALGRKLARRNARQRERARILAALTIPV